MPYSNLSDLPDQVKDNLPHHAQEIYKEAYNSALEQYDDEQRSHQTAWAAVKNKYHKNQDGEWVEDSD
ncbi:TPA: cation transporter [Candidatus Saccharibacteria bacterium]|nr:cation transporter [Candidatus Saccharibacteria bacterium]HIO87298.1 cation transporter [Candidatus Saccharibacteria bacterium]